MSCSSPKRVYRSRKQRPCDACRRRKICCVREANAPACSLCTLRATTCTYQSKPNIRRRQPESSLISTSVPSYESPESISQPFSSNSNSNSNSETTAAEEWTPLFIGFSSDQDPYILRHCHFTGNYFNRPDWKCKRMYGGPDIPMHFSEVPDSHLDTTHDGSPVCPKANYPPETMTRLLETYFEVVHASYPILDKASFDSGAVARGNPALVAIMCRLATPFYAPATNTSSPTEINPQIWPPWRSYLHQTLTTQSRSPRLSTLETALLFTNRPLETHRAPNLPGLWPQIGSMVGMAHELGLNVDPTGWPISDAERKRRVRVWWAVYIADKWNALGGGRPSFIFEGEWDVPVPCVGDFDLGAGNGSGSGKGVEVEVEVEVGARVFIAMSKVTVILGEALGEFYSIKAMRRASQNEGKDDEDVFARLESYMERIDEIVEQDMGFLKEVDDQIRDPTGTLILALSTLRIILYRAILRRSHQRNPRLTPVRTSAQTLCMSLISFVAKLQVSQLRAFWWAPLSRTNFAIAGSFMVSMLLSSTENAEIAFWTEKIARYRGLLEMHSVTFDVTRLAVKRLGLIASVIEGRSGGSGVQEGGAAAAVAVAAAAAAGSDEVPRSPDMSGVTMMPELGSLSSLFGEGLDLFVDFQGLDYDGFE
ncbi:fungal-specific transcription factor domain-containing protein [Aspergillus crustosus]